MKILKFQGLLQQEGWIEPAYVHLDEAGLIQKISNTSAADKLQTEDIQGYAIPGFQNAHSHAFQYAMAGLTEDHPDHAQHNNFWSWREIMYKIALSINPDQLQNIATMLYSEMLRHGYTSVAEFHYLHHDQHGDFYENRGEMAERLILAAKEAGINITLIPIFYQKGGFKKAALPEQKRFISQNRDSYLELWEACQSICERYDHATPALGFHSLRGVDPCEIQPTIAALNKSLPIHIHVSEQLQEVAQCKADYGLRPVEWLMEHVGLSADFQLVHATHINETEIAGIAKSGSGVVLCPSTEGNLGDGFFPFAKFQELNGRWSIGTDSHVGLNPMEELRILDYGQRLISHDRNTFQIEGKRKSGVAAMRQVITQGRKAMGKHSAHFFAEGKSFDALIIDATHSLIATSATNSLLSTILYTGDVSTNLGTMVAGNWVITHQKHKNAAQFTQAFGKSLKELAIRI